MAKRREKKKKNISVQPAERSVHVPYETASGGLGSNPIQNLVALASTKSHPIFHRRRCVAMATRPSHLPIPYRVCILDLHHPLLPSASQSITPHLISPLRLAFSLSCPPSNRWPSQTDGWWITMRGGGDTCSAVQERGGMGWERTCCMPGNEVVEASEELDAKSIWK